MAFMLTKQGHILLMDKNTPRNVEWLSATRAINGIEYLSIGERYVYDGLKGKFITEKYQYTTFDGAHWADPIGQVEISSI
ncbi:hypothetical protein C1645_811046 [Glomus cerebriforme]|uniref:Uncharacterized protein n=1 Tax=Glomus cerebriforme TaxID=658196 RepID=A0A397TX02_9GLOM|nr:hypothetical protein C1645_811046 [Glomus cerebriforme]